MSVAKKLSVFLFLVVISLILMASFGSKRLRNDKDSEVNVKHHDIKYIFIDVGGNVGDTVEKFLNKGIYELPKPSHEFDAIYVFEPSKEFHRNYEKFKDKSFKFKLIPAAASGKDGNLHFAGNAEGGSTLSTDVQSTGGKNSVPTVDFSRWLSKTVGIDDYVVCKIDAEGSEFEIVQRFFADGTLCLCDRLTIEWHGWLICNNTPMTWFNYPPNITDIPGINEGCTGSQSICKIPHLNLELPHFYCTLPRILMFARKGCVGHGVEAKHVLENHDVHFFKD